MTTTVTTELRPSHSSRIRRNALALFAAAAIVASTAFVVSEILDGDSPRVAQLPNESTLGATEMWGAFHAAFIPPEVNPTAAVPPHGRLVINEAMSELCALGHEVACPFSHTWVPVNPLPGLGDAAAGLAAHPL
ncbi:MAG TPA: hypothetical protein VM282_10560 [Acidimicrobiales bacterium]|nr:hypothetical protein [Acidimicrobiales bacterium]